MSAIRSADLFGNRACSPTAAPTVTRTDNEAALVAAAKTGDLSSFEELVNRRIGGYASFVFGEV